MDAPAVDKGVDPKTACKIEVTVTAYFSVIDGRTEYKKGRTLCWTVDSAEYSIVELVKDVQAYYQWAHYQDVEFLYVGEGHQIVKLCNDDELLSLLRASRTVRFDMKIVGEQHGMDTQVVLFNGLDEQIVGVDDLDEQVNELLKEPLFGETVAGPARSGHMKAEVSGVSKNGYAWRYAVNLIDKACSCGQWDVTGKPCFHAIAYITSLRNVPIENYVHGFYSVQRFKDAYRFEVNPMGDKSQWPTLDPGFDMRPPQLERSAGRPKKKRIKSSDEPGKRGPYQCKRCFQFGHIEKGCKNAVVEPDDQDVPEPPPTKKKKGKHGAAQDNTKVIKKSRNKKKEVDQASTSHHPPSSPSSPGQVTRKRAAAMTPTGGSPSVITHDATPSRIKRRLLN